MTEKEKIEYLNDNIIRLNQKIKNINKRDEIVAMSLGLSIILGMNVFAFIYLADPYKNKLYPIIAVASIGLGIVPGISIPTHRTMKKISQYQMEIKSYMNELHGMALEEDKEFEKVKKYK